MGNASSGGGLLGISLSCDTSGGYALAGTLLSGTVFADTPKNVQAASLVASVRGEERCCVRYTVQRTETYTSGGETRTRTRTETRYNYATRRILYLDVPLVPRFEGGLVSAGRYEYPFEVHLPQHLPSTMDCHAEGGWCRVRYKVKAQLKGSGMFRDYKAERPFVLVAAPLPLEPLPYIVQPVTEEVRSCCCFGRGFITFGANLDDTRVGKGAQVGVGLACKNDATVEIEYVEAKITEKVRWYAGGRSNSFHRTLARKQIQRVQGMEKKTKEQIKTNRETGYDPRTAHYEAILAEIMASSRRLMLSIPKDSYDTYKGQCYTADHYMKIKVKTGSCVGDPKVSIPIMIGNKAYHVDNQLPTQLLQLPQPSAPPHPSTGQQQHAASSLLPSAPPFPPADQASIPVAVPAGWSGTAAQAPPVVIAESAAVIGGAIVEGEYDEEAEIDIAQKPIVTTTTIVPNLPNLLRELEYSVNCLGTVGDRLADPEWKDFFAHLTPSEYGIIISRMSIDFDQPEVATLMAPAIGDGDGQITCPYIVCALRSTAEWNRVNMVERLLPHCADLESGQQSIKSELSDWETVCTKKAFEDALQKKA